MNNAEWRPDWQQGDMNEGMKTCVITLCKSFVSLHVMQSDRDVVYFRDEFSNSTLVMSLAAHVS